MTYKGYDIKVNDPTTWPTGGESGPAVATICFDQAEIDTLESISDFHADDEFPVGQWPFCPDALIRIREKITTVIRWRNSAWTEEGDHEGRDLAPGKPV